MKATCDKCGTEFDSNESVAPCPQCGEVIRVAKLRVSKTNTASGSLAVNSILAGIAIIGSMMLVLWLTSGPSESELFHAQLLANDEAIAQFVIDSPLFESSRMTGPLVGILNVSGNWSQTPNYSKQKEMAQLRDLVCTGPTIEADVSVFDGNDFVGHISAAEVSVFD